MSDEQTPVAASAKAAPKKPAVKKTPAEKASTAKRTASSKTATSAPKRKPAAKTTLAEVAVVPATALAVVANDTIDTAKNSTTSAFSAAASKVNAMIPEGLGDKAKDVAGEVKTMASDAVGTIGKLIADSAAAIDDNVGPKYGDYARTAAQSVTDAAERLRAKPVDEIAVDTREFVRNKPGTALGIAAVTSLVLAKILGAIFGKRR